MSLPQDYFTYSEQYRTPGGIYSLIQDTHLNHVIAHEGDRAWRNAIILNRPSLLAMRYVCILVQLAVVIVGLYLQVPAY